MNALFFIIITFLLIVFQTVVLPSFSWFIQCFDSLIIVILFLSLMSSHTLIIVTIIIIGCIMDSISGVPFGYHIFSYIWIFIIVHIVKQFLFKRSLMFILIISIGSVLIQHILLLFSIFILKGDKAVLGFDFGLLVHQAFWGLLFIPPGIWLINILWRGWNFLTKFLTSQLFRNTEGRIERI